jgi:hypothetical protein
LISPPAGVVYRWLDPASLVFVAGDGTIQVAAYTMTFDGTTPPKPPEPPQPPQPPQPPVPVNSKLRVLFVYESADLVSMPPAKEAILTSSAVRAYLKSHCPAEANPTCPTCPPTPSFRFLDKDVDKAKLAPVWQTALGVAVAGGQVPCVLIVNEAGKSQVYPWPESDTAMVELLQTWGGK